MNPDAVPFVTAVIAMFAAFMAVVGGVAIWSGRPARSQRTSTTGSSMALGWAAEWKTR